MFNAPIPGQSLTSEPRNYPWENPPEFANPEEALLFHMDRLKDPSKVKAIAGLLTLGLDVVTLTEGILRGAVAEGRHSVDISMLIGPIVHEYIVGVADAAGIDYDEGLEEDEIDVERIKYSVRSEEAKKILEEIESGDDIDLGDMESDMPEGMDMQEDTADIIEEEPEEMAVEEEKMMGLMSRGTV
tara:strand:+ start:418 stop:975 length:558 start_codon:yes stop_codon:yes gene_type:complete